MRGGEACRLPDAAGYAVWLLCVGWLDFKPGRLLPGPAARACVNAMLLRGHGEVLLVDAGSGPADVLWRGAAALDEALAAAAAAAEDVDAVVLTHLDFDHAGGALAGTWPDDVRPAFRRVVAADVALDWWREHELDEWNVGTRLLDAYRSAGRLELAADDREFRPGLRLVSAPGHRPGHCVLLLGGELVHGADVLHHTSHVEHPEWDAYFDSDPVLALQTRRRWISRLADGCERVVFSHVSGPGRIVPGPSWRPAA